MANMSPLLIDGRWHPEMTYTGRYIAVRYLDCGGAIYRFTENNILRCLPGSRALNFYEDCLRRCEELNGPHQVVWIDDSGPITEEQFNAIATGAREGRDTK